MQGDLEQINRRMQELVNDLLKLSEKKLGEMTKQLGADSSVLGGMKGRDGVDPYRILGLDKSASDDEVKKRYRERLRQFHPDTAGSGMEFHLQAVMAAYELIRMERRWQ